MIKRTAGTSPTQGAAFYRQRDTFLNNWRHARLDLGLGPEGKLVARIVKRSIPLNPWTWVQTGTQAEWAAFWKISHPTLKRHLSALRKAGIITVEVSAPPAGFRGYKLKAGYEYPTYRVHPRVIEYVLGYHDRDQKLRPEALLRELSYQEDCKAQSGPAESEYQEPCKGQNDPYSLLDTPFAGESCKWSRGRLKVRPIPVTPTVVDDPSESVDDKYLTAQPSTIVTVVVVPLVEKSSDGVRRRLRRRRQTGEANMVSRWTDDDDEPPAIGQDPDRPTPASGKTPAATVVVLDTFERAWNDARRDDRLPPRPYSTAKSRVACLSWLKQTFLPSVGGDVELATAIVQLFCEQVAAGAPGWKYDPNPERGSWDLWKHLSPRAETTRQLLLDRGWKSSAELAAEARRAEVRASQSKGHAVSRRQQASEKDEWIKSREGLPILIPFSSAGPEWAHYKWLMDEQTEDYLDWTPVPWDDGLPRYGRVTYEEWQRRKKLR